MQQNVKRKRYKIIYIKYYIDVVVVVVFIFFFLARFLFLYFSSYFSRSIFFFFFFLVSLILLLLLLVASMAYGHTLNRDADRKRSKSITIYLLSAVIPFTLQAWLPPSVPSYWNQIERWKERQRCCVHHQRSGRCSCSVVIAVVVGRPYVRPFMIRM